MFCLLVQLSQVALSILVGGSWHPLLCGSICVHHLRRLRPLLWGRVHAHPCSGYHRSGGSPLHHRSDWLLRHHPGEPLWFGHGQFTNIHHLCSLSRLFLFSVVFNHVFVMSVLLMSHSVALEQLQLSELWKILLWAKHFLEFHAAYFIDFINIKKCVCICM